jgi:predicted HAD superfamily phosphohydrolase YqeG
MREIRALQSVVGGHVRSQWCSFTWLPRHVRTLVLDLDDTLIHSDWTRGRGWRTFKRPGAEDFLRQVSAASLIRL